MQVTQTNKPKKTAVIGSGFSGLSAACFLAREGHNVTVLEKNDTIGGRARAFSESGFTYDMGPSWYWMPDIFEQFFAKFNRRPEDFYQLVRLDPGFQMIFGKGDFVEIPASMDGIMALFESIEKGSADQLKKFLSEGKFKYEAGMKDLVYKPAFSWLEFANRKVLSGAAKFQLLRSMRSHVRDHFKNERLIALLEFPVLFLGATAKEIPALYSLMNYAALSLGTWYPAGGMTEVVKAMESVARSLNVGIITKCEVGNIYVRDKHAVTLSTTKGVYTTNGIIATGDYHHTEQKMLEEPHRNYKATYWDKKTLSPSCLIFYIGVNKKIKKLLHHNLFFDTSLDNHANEIYKSPQWPTDPLFYVCCPSKTDNTVAPEGMENLFLLMPVAPGLEDTEAIREHYFQVMISRMELLCEETILPDITYKKSYCLNDFVSDYHAFKGNAYGLANTLRQTAVLKPTLRNKKVKNLFYAGHLTVPGPGVPPAIISGEIAATQLSKYLNEYR